MTEMPPDGGFATEEFMRSLQLVENTMFHIGTTLTTDADGEPGAGRGLLMQITHRTNMDPEYEPRDSVFALSQGHAMDLAGRVMLTIGMAYGPDVVEDLFARIAEVAERLAAEGGD